MKKVLVIGGNSFVGKALAEKLSQENIPTQALCRTYKGAKKIPGVEYIEGDLRDSKLIATLLADCGTVIHLASDSNPGSSALKPIMEGKSNLIPTLGLLEALQFNPEVRLIYLSTGGAIYGNTGYEEIPETAALHPRSYYGAGKAATEMFIRALCSQVNNEAIILRPSNFFGPGQPFKPGFGIIPTIFKHLIDGTPFTLWGDGNSIRDYLYIDDFIDLLYLLVSCKLQKGTLCYNVGTGIGTSINQLINFTEEVSGRRLKRIYQPARDIDTKKVVLDCSRVRDHYEWIPKISLKTGIESTWDWVSNLENKRFI